MSRAAALNPTRSYDSYDALLHDPDVDVVCIATHNGLHCELGIAALRLGKHVLCEKPLGRNAAECESLLLASEAAGRHLVEAFMYRYHPQIAQAQALIAGGAIGELRGVEASFRYLLEGDDDVRLRQEWGGGALLDVGCYCVNVSRLFLGATPGRILASATFDPAHDIDRSLHGILQYDDGKSAVISCGFDAGLHQKVVLIGTEGVLELEQPFKTNDLGGVALVAPQLLLRNRHGVQRYTVAAVNCYQLEIEDLAQAVANGGVPLLPPEEGLLNARVIERLLDVARGGRLGG